MAGGRLWARFAAFAMDHVSTDDLDVVINAGRGLANRPQAETARVQAEAAAMLFEAVVKSPVDACVLTESHLAVKTSDLVGVRSLTPMEKEAFANGSLIHIAQRPAEAAALFVAGLGDLSNEERALTT